MFQTDFFLLSDDKRALYLRMTDSIKVTVFNSAFEKKVLLLNIMAKAFTKPDDERRRSILFQNGGSQSVLLE